MKMTQLIEETKRNKNNIQTCTHFPGGWWEGQEQRKNDREIRRNRENILAEGRNFRATQKTNKQ